MNKKGFTLTELLAVLVILAVIMTAGFVFSNTRYRAEVLIY